MRRTLSCGFLERAPAGGPQFPWYACAGPYPTPVSTSRGHRNRGVIKPGCIPHGGRSECPLLWPPIIFMENTMNRCEDCPDWEEIYMSEMKKPEKGATPKRITTKRKPGATGPRGEAPARERGNSAFDNQSTDSNNK